MPHRHNSGSIELIGLDGTPFRVRSDTMMAVQVGESVIYKPAIDLRSGDVLVAAQYSEAPSISFDELKRIIRESSPEYKLAYDRLFRNILYQDKSIPVTAFSHILIQGLYEELYGRGLVGSLEELTNLHAEGISQYPNVERVVYDTVNDAIDQYNFRHGTTLSAADTTIKSWIRGDTMKSVKEGIYQALSEYDPTMQDWQSTIKTRPDWSDFSEWIFGKSYESAWQTVVAYHQVLSSKVRELECVRVTDIPDDPLEDILGKDSEGAKPRYSRKVQLDQILPKLGVRAPKTVNFVLKKAPRRTTDPVHVPRNISILPDLKLQKADYSVETALMDAGDLRQMINESIRYYLLSQHPESIANPELNYYTYLATFKVATEFVPQDAIYELNLRYMKLSNADRNVDWVMVNRYVSEVREEISRSGLSDFLKEYFRQKEKDVNQEYQTFLSQKGFSSASLLINPKPFPKEVAAVREAYNLVMSHLKNYKTRFQSVLQIFDSLIEIQPWIPQRYVEMADIKQRLWLDEEIRRGGKQEMYAEFILTPGERTVLENRFTSLHNSLKNDYGRGVPGIYESTYTV